MARNDSGQNPKGRRLTNYQSALLDRLAGLSCGAIERGLNVAESEAISERVRRYVLETGGGLAEVTRATGLPKTTLGPWLKGEKHVSTATFDRICETYGIEPIRMSGNPSNDVPTADQLGELGDSERIRLEKQLAEAKRELDESNRVRAYVSEGLKAVEAVNSTLAIPPNLSTGRKGAQ